MTRYFLGLLAFAVCCAVVELLTPSGEGGGVAGHIKWMSGLCLLCVLVTPIAEILSEGNLIDRLEGALDEWLTEGEQAEEEYQDQWKEQYEHMDATYAEASIAYLLQEKFEILPEDMAVRIKADATGERIEAVYVGLGGRAVWLNAHEIEAYIESMLGCECTTYIK